MPALFTLTFWNHLATAHLSTLVMVLAAVVTVLLDHPIRRSVRRFSKPYPRAVRFLIFVGVCSFGYAALTVLSATLFKSLLMVRRGAYIAPLTLAIFVAAGIIAERQKHI